MNPITPREAAAAIGRVCSVPDDGRWYKREVIHNGLRISAMMRKIGNGPHQYTDLVAVPYEPRVVTKVIEDSVRLRDRVSST